MDAEMISRWNAVVHPDDTVYHLGDISFTPQQRLAEIRAALNGRIVVIKGNHDRGLNALRVCGFDEAYTERWLSVDGIQVYMRHEPMSEFRDAEFHLCGHVHREWRFQGNILNVGVDVWDFRPISLAELIARKHEQLTAAEIVPSVGVNKVG